MTAEKTTSPVKCCGECRHWDRDGLHEDYSNPCGKGWTTPSWHPPADLPGYTLGTHLCPDGCDYEEA